MREIDLALENSIFSHDPHLRGEFSSASILIGEEPTPLMSEDHKKAIREIPREPEVIELFKKLVGAGPLPPH